MISRKTHAIYKYHHYQVLLKSFRCARKGGEKKEIDTNNAKMLNSSTIINETMPF